jgi:ATP-dependent DNA helicase MPH1
VQIHLNFRRENQTTKGKRWDRTEYAQTGRRIRGGVKGKSKGVDKGRGKRASMDDGSDADMDMDEFDEDDEGEPLVPEPKPLVDVCEWT